MNSQVDESHLEFLLILLVKFYIYVKFKLKYDLKFVMYKAKLQQTEA